MRAVEDLGVDDRVEVLERRAEVVGTTDPYREHFDLVTARSFGPGALGPPRSEPASSTWAES